MSTQLKKFSKSALKKAIKEHFGSVSGLKKHLKAIAKYQYGCNYSELEVYGCKVYYTDNPNHFCTFGISIPCVGFSDARALGVSSLTKAGIQRGCAKYVLKL